VHSYHSGHANHYRFLHARDCYSDPFRIYDVAKSRGMDLVCITDHDSIDGCLEFLDRHPDAPDFIMGEEISCTVPDAPSMQLHLGAVGITEAIHREVQRLRGNVFEAAAYLRAQGVIFAVNHPFMFFRGELDLDDYLRRILTLAPALEVRNGAALGRDNALVASLSGSVAAVGPHVITAGSDAHTLQWVGTTYTEAEATSRDEFLAAVREGRARAGGVHGGLWRATSEIYGVVFNYWRGLAGFERDDLSRARRIGGIAFSIASLAIQFIPISVAIRLKWRERRHVIAYERELGLGLAQRPEPLPVSAAGAPVAAKRPQHDATGS
jgi:predicted metal-dependent phosphoesterase TrpH